jgi:threonine aldolase
VLPPAYVDQAAALARGAGLSVHLDGARAWNAAVALGVDIADVCAPFDSVSLCFSKGLGAPVGSVLVGSADLIAKAKRARKMLGGAMRQSGLLAAACLFALEHQFETLAEDHANAALLGQGLSQIEALRVLSVDTNMVFLSVPAAQAAPLQAFLAERGITAAIGPVTRLVLHRDVSSEGVARVVAATKAYFAAA